MVSIAYFDWLSLFNNGEVNAFTTIVPIEKWVKFIEYCAYTHEYTVDKP